MQAYKSYTMVNFLHWMTMNHADVPRLADLAPDQLRQFTEEFDKGDNPEKSTYKDPWEQWSENFDLYSQPYFCGKKHVWEDVLERYKRIPLHAIFLYTSMDKDMDSYIENTCCPLHRLSTNYCDIHPVKSQFENDDEDASDFIRNSKLTKDKHSVGLSKLP